VQQARGWKAHQQTHQEAHHLADRKPGTPRPGQGVGPSTRTETTGPLRPGKVVWPWMPPSPTRRPRRRPTTLPTGAAECIEGLGRRGRERLGPQGQESREADAWVQAKEASYAQKKPNHAAHQGDGTRSPPGRTALLGSAALFGPATSGKNKGKTGQGVNTANFSPATQTPTHATHQGSGTCSPQGSATLLSVAGLFGSNVERKKKTKGIWGRA
jgi:hypothetical protein